MEHRLRKKQEGDKRFDQLTINHKEIAQQTEERLIKRKVTL